MEWGGMLCYLLKNQNNEHFAIKADFLGKIRVREPRAPRGHPSTNLIDLKTLKAGNTVKVSLTFTQMIESTVEFLKNIKWITPIILF